ncbi:MAG: hypothetical protein FJX76_24855, partial [Armatimonadetes bacterium]|nr:hypothetical protein [Armatimonadota bacterium]
MNIPSMQAVNTAYFRSLAAAEQPDPVLGGTKATDDAVVIQAKPAPAQQPPAAAPAAEKQPKTLPGRFARWLNVMSLPQPSTEGNFDGPAWFQAGFQSAVEGFYLGGLAGSLGALSASMSGVFVGYKTGKQLLSVATGAATGAGILAALAHAGGPAAMATAGITGGLLGAYATYRGNCLSRVRDSAGNASMLAGPFFHGTGKVAAGLGAATAVHFTSNKK